MFRLFAFAALAVSLSLSGANAQPAPKSRQELAFSFSGTVKKAKPSVVNVYALKRTRVNNPLMNDEFFRRFFEGMPRGMPQERVQRSLGSGVIISEDGLVITNFHVIDGADDVRLALSDRREFEADVVLRDPRTDLAVLRIRDAKEKFVPIEFVNSDDIEVGDLVLAIGDPFGVGQTVTQGIISATSRTRVGVADYQFFIQTDAAINPGNSGGALVDIQGRLVGINTAIFSRSGGSHGIGFAIPSNMVRVVLASAQAGNMTVRRPFFGAQLQQVTAEIAQAMRLKRPAGALVASVVPESPAARAGLRAGDVIVAVDGQNVDDPNAVNYRLALRPIGQTAQLSVERGGRAINVTLNLEAAPEKMADEVEIQVPSPFEGVRISNFTPELAMQLRTDADAQGVVVIEVLNNSTAQRLGFRSGDIIINVNGARIETTRDLDRASRQNTREWRVTLSRNGQQRQIMLRN
ncbi:MAG: Do family serine endopeptidase [Xanthobacteraceae bacterium]|nr:Do family serine endopeptidase [Xanthobacteraceae bacterium]QYK43885.1 MAG: Do family serine endopeptidase [Xanthobacteraceae bacterium]HMN51830.1 Do family serine endopeptidase [Xanthobacteraceae bacterium]